MHKSTLQIDPELPRRAVLVPCSRCPLSIDDRDCLVTIGAKTGTQRCQVAAWLNMPLAVCPVPFSAKMRMLIAIAIVPRHSKARTMLTRRSFRCCKNGLAVFFLAMVRQQYFEPLDLAQLLDLMADILWSFRLFFFTFGKIVA